MKTFEQSAEEYYQKSGWVPTEGAVMNFKAGFESCDQQWREEIAKDRGVISYADAVLKEFRLADAESAKVHFSSYKITVSDLRRLWAICESSWRHKTLNIEQSAQMKIQILERSEERGREVITSLERQIEEMKKDLDKATCSARFYIKHWCSTDSGMEGIREKDARAMDEIRQRHKLDEVRS